MHGWEIARALLLVMAVWVVEGFVRLEQPQSMAWISSSLQASNGNEQQKISKFCRYRCRVAYDGTFYSGFQLQQGDDKTAKKEKVTIQGILE